MPDRDANGALAEFAALRTEMDSRAKYQQQILALQLTLTSAIFAFALSAAGRLAILLIVPLSSYLLCGRYIGQRSAMLWAARYISEQLSPRISGGLSWTQWSARNRRPDRLLDWFLPLLICFPGASLLAMGWTAGTVFRGGHPVWTTVGLVAVWAVGAFATATSAYLIGKVFWDRRSIAVGAAAPPQTVRSDPVADVADEAVQ